MSADLAIGLTDFVGTISFNRPPNNFFSVDLLRRIADAIDIFDGDDACRAIVLRSEGRIFCAGADFVAADEGLGSETDGQPDLYAQGLRLFAGRKPIVAAIQGAAIGGGMGLALAADFRIASTEARFAVNFVKIGLHPGFGLTHTLPRLIGDQRAALLLLTGRRIGAQQAFEWGLVDEVVAPEELLEATVAFARELAANAPLSVIATRQTLRQGLVEAIRARTGIEYREQLRLQQTEDFAEGVKAVAERRPGVFRSR